MGNAPVRTCSGGLTGTRLTDIFARSGCESGGSAYTCINQQPWVVNSTFAYGFAAAKIQGQGERDWCCACYELRFTSGTISTCKSLVAALASLMAAPSSSLARHPPTGECAMAV